LVATGPSLDKYTYDSRVGGEEGLDKEVRSRMDGFDGFGVRGSRRVIHALFVLTLFGSFLTTLLVTLLSACGEACDGVLVDGRCEPKCVSSNCVAGNTCVDNRCALVCDSHLDCEIGTQSCVPAKEDDTGRAIFVCAESGKPAIGKSCPKGDECSAELSCLTRGSGDAEAYCTRFDCRDDKDCPGGFQCGTMRDPHAICGSSPQKGDNNICGKTDEPCIDPSSFSLGGASYFEGSICLLRRLCFKRSQCSACESDLDCSLVSGQRCVQIGKDKRCARACAVDGDCDDDYRCVEGSCVPRFGACTGTGLFCEPCSDDEDCGSKGSSMGCYEMGLSGERACVDYSFSTACTKDTDCPKAPSGRFGKCLDELVGVQPGDSLYHRCFLPFESGEPSCW